MKTLVVCYSNSGNTMTVAENIAQALEADFDAIEELRPRPPLLFKGKKSEAGGGAIAKAVLAAIFGTGSAIAATRKNPAQYDLVVVGTPIWGGSLTPAVRSYLKRHREALPQVAFFCSAGDPSRMRAFNQMRKIVGKDPVATVAVKADEARTEDCATVIAAFVSQVKAAGQASGPSL